MIAGTGSLEGGGAEMAASGSTAATRELGPPHSRVVGSLRKRRDLRVAGPGLIRLLKSEGPTGHQLTKALFVTAFF
jgi:hypothetical protein